MAKRDRQNRTGRTGQAERDRHNGIDRTGQARQTGMLGLAEEPVRARLPEQICQDKNAE